jgi:hypothetical protein
VDSYPAFTSIGGYDFSTQIDSAPAGTGLTAGDHRAFYSAIRLNGILSKKFNGSPMEYQFDVSELDGAGNPVAWHVVDSSQIAPTDIGKWEHYAPAFPGDPNPIKIKHYVVNGAAGPSTLVPSVVAGWIRVPQESDVFAASGSFVPNGNQILLDTTTLRPWPSIDLTGLQAGQSSTSTGKALATDVGFALRMRVREVGSAAAGTVAGFCQRVAIDNTLYDHLLHHPEWMAVNESNALGVAMIDIQEEISHPCSEIADSLTVLFTAAHPNLGAPSISMSGPGGPYAFTLPAPATAGDQFGTATPSGFVVADLAPCAYIVGLSVPLLLTTGDSVPLPLYDQMPFCKGSPMMGGGGGGD